MPLTDDREQDTAADDRVTQQSGRYRLALPIPIIRGARQTTILPRFRARSWLASSDATQKPEPQRLTTQCRPAAALPSCLLEVLRPGTSLVQDSVMSDQSEIHLQDLPTPGQESEHSTLLRPTWSTSKSSLRNPIHHNGPPHPGQRWSFAADTHTPLQRLSIAAEVHPVQKLPVLGGTASDVLRRPSRSNQKSKSENGVAAEITKPKGVPPATKYATRVQSLSDRAGEVQPLRSVQSKRTPPPSTVIAAPAFEEVDSIGTMESQAMSLRTGMLSGSLDMSDRPSSEVSTAPSSVHIDRSIGPSGIPSSSHRLPSRPLQLPSHQPKTSCPPTSYQARGSASRNPLSEHARLLPPFEEELLTNDNHLALHLNETRLDIRSPESDGDGNSPASPRSLMSSLRTADGTPMTSPSRSPARERPNMRHFSPFTMSIPQLDGEASEAADEAVEDDAAQTSHRVGGSDGAAIPQHPNTTTDSENDVFYSSYSNQPLDDRFTPLVTPTPAKGARAFPFPLSSSTARRQARHPSTLFHQYERITTPRQIRLMTGGPQSLDRFIPSRAGTPTKQSLHLAKYRPKPAPFGPDLPESDPFGPVPARSLRMADQYATLRSPAAPLRPTGVATRTEEPQAQSRRAASAGTIWTVGGTMVTEGIASVTNGRGGRVTSGTNAPHYVADFLRKNSPSEDEVTHSRRLAIAMGIDRAARMLVHSSPGSICSSPDSGSPASINRIWKDGVWQREGCVTPTKSKAKKVKDVPVIPFRVLDAPALRDDYYCSLLSYSPTIQCLAVGLGPHVYLWSEKRGPKGTPDSLTAPAGSSHVTSVSFSSVEGGSAILALGRADGRITLWSPLDQDPRFDSDQPSPISCLAFRPTTIRCPSLRDANVMVPTEELLVGDEVGFVYYYSVEWPNQDQRDLFDWHGSMSLLARIECHSQQVCGLAWSSDGAYFGTGGNDNQLFLFESKSVLKRPVFTPGHGSTVRVRASGSDSSNATVTAQADVLTIIPGAERHIFALNAAVKAIAFAPWQPTLLAAGGGSNDRCIHFFHTLSGAPLATIDCHAQVTSLVWSEKRKEIASTFGFAQPEHPYRVAVFAWPSCDMVVRIPWWSEERALFAVAYPRGPTTGQQQQGQGQGASSTTAQQRTDAEGRPWYGRRTREEGCLVVATSDASIKFHEIWAEKGNSGGGKEVESGVFGGSRILEEEGTGDMERWGRVIR